VKLYAPVLIGVLTLAACGSSTNLTYTTDEDGIKGSFNTSEWTTKEVKQIIENNTCASGKLAAYEEEEGRRDGDIRFTATCASA